MIFRTGCMYCEDECNKECLKEAAEKLKGRELFKESNDRARKMLSEVKSLPIVETLEEAAEKHIKKNSLYFDTPYEKNHSRVAFIEGAKWQAERSYSEEEMRTAISIAYSKGLAKPNSGRLSDIPNVQNDIFQQFKKK